MDQAKGEKPYYSSHNPPPPPPPSDTEGAAILKQPRKTHHTVRAQRAKAIDKHLYQPRQSGQI